MKAVNKGDEKDAPSDRYGHSAILDASGGGNMLIFGGCDNKGVFLNDLYMYNIEMGVWSKPETSDCPPGRINHSAVLYGDSIYIFGGNSNAFYNDLYRHNLDTLKWSLVKANSAPSPRYGHTGVVFGDSMYIFGGYDKDGFACNDIYEFSFEINKWTHVKPNGTILSKDTYHHSAVVHEGSMYVFGGYKIENNNLMEFRFGNRTWSMVKVTGTPPAPRWGHSALVFNGVMYIFGGRDAITNFNDLYEFHFESQMWKGGRNECGDVTPRFFSSVIADDEYMYIFGGKNIWNFSFNELYKYNLATKWKKRPDSLADDLRKLVNNPKLSDVKFIFPLEENQELYSHKNILSSRCEIFRAMFRSGMKESREGNIIIKNLKKSTFLSLLDYLYTGQLLATAENIIELLQAADLYVLEHLKALCERKLARYVELNNVINMLQLADQFKAPELKEHCLIEIAKHLPELKDTETFKSISQHLNNEITLAYAFYNSQKNQSKTY